MSAYTCPFFMGSSTSTPYTRVGLLFDISQQHIQYPPGGYEELEAISSTMWRYAYPIEVVNACRK